MRSVSRLSADRLRILRACGFRRPQVTESEGHRADSLPLAAAILRKEHGLSTRYVGDYTNRTLKKQIMRANAHDLLHKWLRPKVPPNFRGPKSTFTQSHPKNDCVMLPKKVEDLSHPPASLLTMPAEGPGHGALLADVSLETAGAVSAGERATASCACRCSASVGFLAGVLVALASARQPKRGKSGILISHARLRAGATAKTCPFSMRVWKWFASSSRLEVRRGEPSDWALFDVQRSGRQ